MHNFEPFPNDMWFGRFIIILAFLFSLIDELLQLLRVLIISFHVFPIVKLLVLYLMNAFIYVVFFSSEYDVLQ